MPRPRSMAQKMVAKNRPDQQKTTKKKKEDDEERKTRKLTRLLITVSVAGRTGPLRFLVNENDVVSDVILITLKAYARLGRLPLLGCDPSNFLLYCPPQLHALSPKEAIGCCGARNFVLWKKEANMDVKGTSPIKDDTQNQNRRWNSKWKSCFIVQSELAP
ncbi:uncharacterized protein LOC129301667 isoform X1 [Prosopis cineraria]|uniref:uncharacterized protein LOC129301667 isoform X1 n=1 Tax=Prosopis cineraria TaxID=364024 RepID=UPI00240EE5C7|nr:uncharacterized protein LOC129301667 isoform X1 [Prosopis cineraria]